MKRFLALVLTAVLLLGCVPGALAAKKDTNTDATALRDSEWTWFYLPSTVPEGLLVDISRPKSIQMYQTVHSGEYGYEEYADSITLEFVSGDEALRDAIQIGETEVGVYEHGQHYGAYDSTKKAPGYYVDLDRIQEPGRAVFHFTCESEHLIYEKDVTLRILSWEEYPLFTTGGTDEKVITLSKGDQMSESQMRQALLNLRTEEIANQIRQGDEEMYNGVSMYPELYDKATGEYVPCGDYAVGANNNTESGAPVDRLFSPWQGYMGYWFKDYGVYEVRADIHMGNIRTEAKATLAVLPYRISCPAAIAPGAVAQVSVTDAEPDSGRTFTLEVTGEGVTLDAEAGTLTADENAENGTGFMMTATPSDGGYPVTLSGVIANGALGGEKFKLIQAEEGLTLPLISDEDGKYQSGQTHTNRYLSTTADDSAAYMIQEIAAYYEMEEFLDREEDALRILKDEISLEGVDVTEDVTEQVNGRPARIVLGMIRPGDEPDYYMGMLGMAINRHLVLFRVFSYCGNGGTTENLPPVTLSDMLGIAEQVAFDPSQATITTADGALTVAAKNGEQALTAGRRIQYTAAFANPDRVNKKAKNDTVEWSVADAETGEAPEGIKIDKNGNLSADAKIAVVKKVLVQASSPIFHTSATAEVTVIPQVKKITVEPAELFFYVGTDTVQTVRAVLDPDTVPPIGITWTPSKKDVLEITAADDGTAQIRALAAGKYNVNVKEPGGKACQLRVSIVEPVTAVTLALKGKAKPGQTVTIAVTLEPKNAGNKGLEWAIDADESVATINDKGQMRIAKEAQAGTEITVTCRALGAPEPVEEKLVVTVE